MNLKSLLFLLCLLCSVKSYAAEDAPLTHEKALQILNIEDKKENETQEKFKDRVHKAYLAQSKKYHPDKNPNNKPAEEILIQDPEEINSSTNSPDDIIKETFLIFLSQLIKKNKSTIFYLTSDEMPIDNISLEPDYITEAQASHLQTTFMQDENTLTAEKWISSLLEYLHQEKLLSLFCNLEYENDKTRYTIIEEIIEHNLTNLMELFLKYEISIETNASLPIKLIDNSKITIHVSLLAAAVLLKKPAIVELLLKNGANPDYKIDANLFGTDSLVTRAFMQGDIESVNYLLLAGAKSSLVNIILCGKFCENASKLPENTSEEQQIKQIVVGQAGLTFIRCATPTKSTMLPLSFVATAGFIAKDLFNFKTEYTKKRKEKAEEKERQEAKELETRLMKQQMHINAVDAASSTQEESKETSDKKEKQTQKVNRSPIKQLQHFMQKYGRDIKKNPRHHALLACTLIPWILHYSCWR
jgi:hypothetical protein